jgi:hypothetical protein
MPSLRLLARLTLVLSAYVLPPLVPLAVLAAPVHAQTVDDGIMIDGKILFTGYRGRIGGLADNADSALR